MHVHALTPPDYFMTRLNYRNFEMFIKANV